MIRVRPFLKWAGNKFRCLETILAALPKAARLIEPFTGSGAIFMNSQYSAYLLAEENLDLVNLFQFLQVEGSDFIQFCRSFFTEAANDKLHYYQLRHHFNQCTNPRQRAALFLYLNRHGYNGLCRYNQKGSYNVPFGRYKKPYFPAQEMSYFYQKASQVEFIQADFRQTFAAANPGDLIYCDPPYVPLSSSANFASYTHKKFSEGDQIDLANLALVSQKKGITVVISNHDTPFTRHHYQQARLLSFPVQRSISCQGNKRQRVQELLAVFQA